MKAAIVGDSSFASARAHRSEIDGSSTFGSAAIEARSARICVRWHAAARRYPFVMLLWCAIGKLVTHTVGVQLPEPAQDAELGPKRVLQLVRLRGTPTTRARGG